MRRLSSVVLLCGWLAVSTPSCTPEQREDATSAIKETASEEGKAVVDSGVKIITNPLDPVAWTGFGGAVGAFIAGFVIRYINKRKERKT